MARKKEWSAREVFQAGVAACYLAAAVVFYATAGAVNPYLPVYARVALAATWPTSFGRFLIPAAPAGDEP